MNQISLNSTDILNLIKCGTIIIHYENTQLQIIMETNEITSIGLNLYNSSIINGNQSYPYILTKNNLCELFQFGKTKMDIILNANILPAVQIRKDYRITFKQIDEWFKKNGGKRILL